MRERGISTVISIILMLVITMALAGSAWVFMSGILSGKTAQAFEIVDTDKNKVIIKNSGTVNISSMTAILDGNETSVYLSEPIQSGQIGEIIIPAVPTEERFHKLKLATTTMRASGIMYYEYPNVYLGDADGDGSAETYLDGQLVEISIEDQYSVYTYNGHPSHYLGWPLYVDQEIWYVSATTGEQVQQITYPNNVGESDFKIVRCQNDGTFAGCTPITIGNRGTCTDGVVKDYADLEPSSWTTYYDDNYKDCDTGNPRLIHSYDPWDHSSGTKTRVQFEDVYMSSYGKHQLCVKYIHDNGMYSAPRCMEFITEWVDMDFAGDSGGNKVFGSTISFSASNVRTRYDNQPILSNYVEKYCRIHPWGWIHYPNNDNSPSITISRHSSWENRYGYLGVLFGISSSQTGLYTQAANISAPPGCWVRDTKYDGSGRVYVYHHNCGWGWRDSGWCCGDDCIEFGGIEGGWIKITDTVNADGDNYDDWRVYFRCPDSSYFGNIAEKYTVTTSGNDYLWVNDMDYSAEKTFTEALPDSQYQVNTNDFTCNNLNLNFCGRAYVYIELRDWAEIYGNKYTSPSSICVSGAECPHATC